MSDEILKRIKEKVAKSPVFMHSTPRFLSSVIDSVAREMATEYVDNNLSVILSNKSNDFEVVFHGKVIQYTCKHPKHVWFLVKWHFISEIEKILKNEIERLLVQPG